MRGWKHLDADGEKLIHNGRYVYDEWFDQGLQPGRVVWHVRHGYVFSPDISPTTIQIIPWRYRSNMVLVYTRVRKEEQHANQSQMDTNGTG